jgi:hypothetical protein
VCDNDESSMINVLQSIALCFSNVVGTLDQDTNRCEPL